METFFLYALLAGIGFALVAGPLGCLMTWRRMAFFGDTLSHSALMGVALGFLLNIDLTLGVLIAILLITFLLFFFNHQLGQHFSPDTSLGILAHGSLAIGMVFLSFAKAVQVDLLGYLFGDILAVSALDLIEIWGGGLVILLLLIVFWRQLLSITVAEEIAFIEDVKVSYLNLLFMLLLAFIVLIALKVVGILLVTALLIMPPAAARPFAKTPEQMALFSSLIGCFCVLIGLYCSLLYDIPTGPSIVMVALLLVIGSLISPSSLKRRG